jgi:hypothetical protein
MRKYILNGIVLISALALGSCSTTSQLASSKPVDDDVYFSEAKAGDAPVQVERSYRQETYANAENEDDYYYYDSYASRINRFSYYSPYSYYNDIYYGYSPYGYSPYNSGWGIGVGLGWGNGYYGYSPYGYSGLGWGGYYGYSPYNYYGIGYGYGGGLGWGGYGYGGNGYWGVYSANRSVNTPRPYRGSGSPNNGYSPRVNPRVSYGNGSAMPGYSSRPARGSAPNGGNIGVSRPQAERPSRPVREEPTYRPTSIERTSSPSPSSSGGGRSGGGGGGGGGARPSRP